MQRLQLKQLDITKDILVDELEQGMKINQVIKDSAEVDKICNIRCPDCISKSLLKVTGGLFGDDSDDDYQKDSKKKWKESGEIISDPLGDSLPDKNVLSRSEQSLQKPLQLFREENEQTDKEDLQAKHNQSQQHFITDKNKTSGINQKRVDPSE